MRYKNLFILFLFLTSGIFYYLLTAEKFNSEEYLVLRVLDADTIEIENSIKVRLLGINAPEKGELYYNESTSYLKNLLENKTIRLEYSQKDKYGRILGHVFIKNVHINKKIVEEGFAHLYYYEKDKYYNSLSTAEEFARLNKKGIWKKSKYSNCIELIEFIYKEKPSRCTNNEMILLRNSCSHQISLTIKDDATHIYKEEIEANSNLEKNFSCIWNDEGDTIYIWDQEGIILSYRY